MKLMYRGVAYDYNPPHVEYGDLTQSGTYRGVDIRFRNPKKPLVLQPTLDLLYRGVAYTTNPANSDSVDASIDASPAIASANNLHASATAAAPKALSIQDRARTLMMDHHRVVKQREQSMLSRLNARVGIPADQAVI